MMRREGARAGSRLFPTLTERLSQTLPRLSLAALLFLFGVSLTLWYKHQPPRQLYRATASEPARVVAAYWELAAKGEVNEACKYQTNSAEGIGRAEPPDTTMATLIHMQRLNILKVEDETVKGDEAKIIVAATSDLYGGFTRRCELRLLKQNGEWKIFTVSIL